MKHLSLPILFIGATLGLSAETPVERELQLLAQQRDAAIATAAEPIYRRYQASLDQLLKRATQSGDLDGVVKIREAIASIPVPGAPAQTKGTLAALLKSGRWYWYSTSDFTGKSYLLTFTADNRCTIEPGVQFLAGWEALNSKQVRINLKSGTYYVFDIDQSKKEGVNNPREGTQKEPKSIRLESK